MRYSDSELLAMFPGYLLADLRYCQATAQLWAVQGNTMQGPADTKVSPLIEQWRDYHPSYWPGFIGHI